MFSFFASGAGPEEAGDRRGKLGNQKQNLFFEKYFLVSNCPILGTQNYDEFSLEMTRFQGNFYMF